MSGARIDVIEASIWHFKAYLLSLPDKKTMTAVVKRIKTSRLDRNHLVFCSYGRVWRFLASHDYAVYEIMSVCMCVKQQTDDYA